MTKIFHAGIDLGTSRSAIATDTGKRLSTLTCVGYPKDMISKKRLKKAHLFGEEALKNRLALNLVWPLAEGVINEDEQAIEVTRLVLQKLLTEALPEKAADDKVYVAIGVPAQAGIQSKKAILTAIHGLVDKVIIVSESFAVAYSLERFDECLIVDIGAGTTDLCRMHGAMPLEEDQLTLKVAGNYFDRMLSEALVAEYSGVQVSPQIIKQIKEKHSYVVADSENAARTPVKVTLSQQGLQKEYDITVLLDECCVRFVTPISEAIQQLIGSFDPDFQEQLRRNVILAGGGSRLKGIDLAVEKSLLPYGGGEVSCVQDAEYCGCDGALKMCLEMPTAYWEQL